MRRRGRKLWAKVALINLTLGLLGVVSALAQGPAALYPGEVIFLPAKRGEKRARFLNHLFYPVKIGSRKGFLLAAPFDTSPGTYTALVEGLRPRKLLLRVRPKSYPEERLTLPRKMVEFPPAVLARIQREWTRLKRALSSAEGSCRWEKPFVLPAQGRISSPFGLRRILNGQPRSPHSGVDLALPKGTPVKAAQEGRVELVGDFYLPGRVVILSHGCGVHTYYAHLSKILVRPGVWVKQGQVIGLSGASGRATGPHLHFGFYVSGVKVNPLQALKILETSYGPSLRR